MTSDELDRARNYLALGVPRRFETVGAVAEHVAHVMLHDLGDDYYDRFMERVGAVTADEVRAVAARHLDPDNTSIVIAGDHAAIEDALAKLDEGPVQRIHLRELTGGEAAGTALA